MAQHGWNLRIATTVAIAIGAATLGARADDVIIIDPNNGYGANNRPGFLFVSATDTFGVPDISDISVESLRDTAGSLGTPLVGVKIGTHIAGPTLRKSRFESLGDVLVSFDGFVDDTGQTPTYQDNQATIVGSLKLLAPDNSIHMITPYPGSISASVQEAWFNASVWLEGTTELPQFPTTVQVALFVYDHQGTAGASVQSILQAVFGTVSGSPPVTLTVNGSLCRGEGVLFPHDPLEDPLFNFSFVIDLDDGSISVDVCLPVSVDVKPTATNNRVNGSSDHGVVPIAILATEDFDAADELDPDTVNVVVLDENGDVISSVAPDRATIEDVNDDGLDDVLFHFSVPDLTAGSDPALTSSTTTLNLRGETFDGLCVEGSDSVHYIQTGH